MKIKFATIVLALTLLFACSATGQVATGQVATDVAQRIVVVGDVHGDYQQMVKALRMTGIIDKRNKWVGGDAHLVQMGDLPDRGPATRKAMDLLLELTDQARESGGQVTVLVGNHEAMMMIGDLRFVHPGEYAEFRDRQSRARRKAYYQQTVDYLSANAPEGEVPKFDRAFREDWEARHPLGYVEHRLAWAPSGYYGKWVLSRPSVVIIGDSLFVHAGLDPEYAGLSVSEINTRVRTALAQGEQVEADSIVEAANGPLWDRGWITRVQNEENTQLLEQVLEAYGVKRMVIGHTPIVPIILPRFGARLLLNDVGLSDHYGGGMSALEIVGDASYAWIEDQKIALPPIDGDVEAYLDQAAVLLKDTSKIERYREIVKKAAAAEAEQAVEAESASEAAESNP